MYQLSKIIPVRFTSRYSVSEQGILKRKQSTWWQWRGLVWAHKIVEV